LLVYRIEGSFEKGVINKMDKFVVKMDIRGFIRFSGEIVKELKLDKMPYADLEVDKAGSRIAVTPSKVLKTTSFRFMPNGSGYLLYFKGALNAVGFQIATGAYTMTKWDHNSLITLTKNANFAEDIYNLLHSLAPDGQGIKIK